MHDDVLIPLSVFQNKDDNKPERHDLAWHAFAQRLCRYEERDSKDGRAWSPVTYHPGATRGKQNVDQVYALVMDVDHAELPKDLLDGREVVAHTTYQHTPLAPRWRAILPLSRPVAGPDWPAFWLRAQAHFGGCIDPQTKDSSRIFYLPSCPPGAEHQVFQQHGTLLDPNSLPEVPRYEPPPRRRQDPAGLLGRQLSDWAARFCLAKIDELAAMPPASGRNSACNRLAYLLAGLAAEPQHDLRPDWIADQLLEASMRNHLVDEDGEASVRATIRSGLEAGQLKAWSPADQEPVPFRARSQARNGTNGHVHAEPQRGERLEVVRMSHVVVEAVNWLWRNRLARGKATLLMGDPGLGKSLISHWLAAQCSVGGPWPDGSGNCDLSSAILFTIEDGLGDTVAPRLEAAGADRERIVAISGVVNLEQSLDERMFALDEHVNLLEELIRAEHASLVVMDPVTAYLGANVNAHRDQDVRRVLGPLQQMAERTGVALLLLMHLTKGSGVSALYRATGSIAFPAVCRIVLGVAPDPNDADGKRRLLLPIKMNIAREAQGIGYHIETTQQQILPRADEKDQPPIIVWDDEDVLVDATSAMDRTGTVQEMGALAECKRAIEQIFEEQTEIWSKDAERQLKEAGVSTAPAVLVRARRELGITFRKEGKHGAWYWIWPQPLARARARNDSPDTRETRNTNTPLTPMPQGSQDSKDSQDFNFSRARARSEPIEMRYCPVCQHNLPTDDYDQHLPCPPLTPELCPVHHKLWDLHECDQLGGEDEP